jgi:hypothetical protein
MIVCFDLQEARQAVEKARQALMTAENSFDTDCGPQNSRALINGIKAAERRLAEANSELSRLRSGATK